MQDKSSFLISSWISPGFPLLFETHLSEGSVSKPRGWHIQFLGIFSLCLSFVNCISLIKINMSRNFRIFSHFPDLIVKLGVHCLFQSFISYCSPSWMSTFSSFLVLLSKVHDKARNIILEINSSVNKQMLDLKYFCILSYVYFNPMMVFLLPWGIPSWSCLIILIVISVKFRKSTFIHSFRFYFNPLTPFHSAWNTQTLMENF